MWSSLSYSPDGQFLLAERTFGTGMIIEKKLSHGGSDDLLLWPVGLGRRSLGEGGRRADQPDRDVGSRAERAALVGGRPSTSISPLRRAAPRTCSASRRDPARRSSRSPRAIVGSSSMTFDKAMTRIAYTVGTYESPSDVWTASIDGTGEKRLTDLFADIRDRRSASRRRSA